MNEAAKQSNDIRPLLGTKDVTALLGVSKSTIKRWVEQGDMPEPQRYGRRLLRWNEADIKRFMRQDANA